MIDVSNAKKRYMFNEQRRLYDAIEDDDSKRLAGVFGVEVSVIESFQKEVDRANATAIATTEFHALFQRLQEKSLRIMVIGDSNTSFRGSFINLIKQGLIVSHTIDIIDTSIPGLATLGVLDHLFDQVMIHEFDIALVMIGTNDVRRHGGDGGTLNCSLAEYSRNISEIFSYLGQKSEHIIGINIPPISSARMEENFGCNWGVSEDDIKAFNTAFKQAIETQNGSYIDLYGMVNGVTDESVLPDGLHIHPEVHVQIAKKVLELLVQLGR